MLQRSAASAWEPAHAEGVTSWFHLGPSWFNPPSHAQHPAAAAAAAHDVGPAPSGTSWGAVAMGGAWGSAAGGGSSAWSGGAAAPDAPAHDPGGCGWFALPEGWERGRAAAC